MLEPKHRPTPLPDPVCRLRHLSHHNRKLLLIAKIELTVYHIMIARFHLRTAAKNALVGQCFNNQIYYLLSYHPCYVPISNNGALTFNQAPQAKFFVDVACKSLWKMFVLTAKSLQNVAKLKNSAPARR